MIKINHLKFISKDLYFVQYVMVLDLHDVLDQHTEFDFYSASSLKHQPADRHVAPLGHIILIPVHPVFALSPECCVLSGESTNTNLIVFGLTQSGMLLINIGK
jgi:hypothetical protein